MPTEADPRFRSASRRALTGGFLGSLFSVGMTIYLFGVFQDALVEAFSTSVATLSFAPAVFTAVSGVLSPLVGRSLAREGRSGRSIRSVMATGSLALGLGLLLVSQATTLVWAALAFGLLVAPGAILMGPLLGQALVTNWFDRKRGQALGIVSAGTTVGGMLMPPLAAALIGFLEWRNAMASLGLLAIVLVLPTLLALVRDRPEDLGLRPDGADAETAAENAAADRLSGAPEAVDTRALLANPSLWLVGITFGLIFSAGLISTVFMIPYASEIGLPLLGGSMIAGGRAGFAAAGKIVFGGLSDRLGVKRVLYGVVVTEICLTAVLIQVENAVAFSLLAIAIGFVGGAPLPLKAAMAGQIFGRANFAPAMGLLATVAVPFQLFMVPVAGALYQRVESYAAVFALTLPCFALGALMLFFVRVPDASAGEEA